MRTEDPDGERDGHDEPAYRSILRIELEDGTVSVVDVPGYRTLQPGQAVVVDWEERDQDGFTYTATGVSLPPAAPR
jgi:hypothetical protein